MGKNMGLPPGFRYYPTDEELISCYLKPKILGQKLPCDIVSDAELYGPNSTPWHLFDVNDDDSWTDNPERPSEKFLYVFTSLFKVRTLGSKKGATRENTCKKAGCGTWGAKTSRKLIKDREGNLIGERRQLVFEINEIGPRFDLSKAGYFRMHEYSLCGVNKGLKSAHGCGDVVLCKITFDSDKEPILKLGSKGADHGSKSCGEDENKGPNNEKGTGVYLDGTSDSVVEMNSSVGVIGVSSEGTEGLTSKNVFAIDNGVPDFNNYVEMNSGEGLTLETMFSIDNGVPDFNNHVEMNSGVGINNKGPEGLTSETVFAIDNGVPFIDNFVEMNSGVGINSKGTEVLTSETGFWIDNVVPDIDDSFAADRFFDGDDSLAVVDRFFLESDNCVGEPSFNMDWLVDFLTSDQEQGLVEDISKLGKRKYEEENLCMTKKMCP